MSGNKNAGPLIPQRGKSLTPSSQPITSRENSPPPPLKGHRPIKPTLAINTSTQGGLLNNPSRMTQMTDMTGFTAGGEPLGDSVRETVRDSDIPLNQLRPQSTKPGKRISSMNALPRPPSQPIAAPEPLVPIKEASPPVFVPGPSSFFNDEIATFEDDHVPFEDDFVTFEEDNSPEEQPETVMMPWGQVMPSQPLTVEQQQQMMFAMQQQQQQMMMMMQNQQFPMDTAMMGPMMLLQPQSEIHPFFQQQQPAAQNAASSLYDQAASQIKPKTLSLVGPGSDRMSTQSMAGPKSAPVDKQPQELPLRQSYYSTGEKTRQSQYSVMTRQSMYSAADLARQSQYASMRQSQFSQLAPIQGSASNEPETLEDLVMKALKKAEEAVEYDQNKEIPQAFKAYRDAVFTIETILTRSQDSENMAKDEYIRDFLYIPDSILLQQLPDPLPADEKNHLAGIRDSYMARMEQILAKYPFLDLYNRTQPPYEPLEWVDVPEGQPDLLHPFCLVNAKQVRQYKKPAGSRLDVVFGTMNMLLGTIQSGAHISQRIFVTRAVWLQTVKLDAIEAKKACLEMIIQFLGKLQANPNDAVSILQPFEEAAMAQESGLTKKLKLEQPAAASQDQIDQSQSPQLPRKSKWSTKLNKSMEKIFQRTEETLGYVQLLEQVFQNSFLLLDLLKMHKDNKQVKARVLSIAMFLYRVVCVFAIRDLQVLLERHIKKLRVSIYDEK